MKSHLVAFILLLLNVLAFAQPPEPALGQRWVLNEKFSDEFSGTELDYSKWNDYYPGWTGRVPGIFLPSQVKVGDGYMSIRGEKLAEDTVVTNWDGSKSTYNIAGGAVTSKSLDAWFGYYECRFKAAATTMSTTFWMSTRGNSPGPEPCNDSYGLELDIQECIGREGDFSGKYFAKGMHSNSHFWYKDCSGANNDYRAVGVNFEAEELASDGFNTYGGWWRDETRATYYYNNNEAKSHNFYSAVKPLPFDRTMGVNLVSETYPFPWISLPTDEELADSSKNICFYDWVRAYSLKGVDEPLSPGDNLIQNGGFETGDFTYWTGWGGSPREVVSGQAYEGNFAAHIGGPGAPEYVANLRAFTTYSLTCYGKVVEGSGPIYFGIKDPSDKVLGSVQVGETSYTRKTIQFTTESSGGRLRLYFYAPNAGDEGYADKFELVQMDAADTPKETVMFNEQLNILETSEELTSGPSLEFILSYMANADREINLSLYNPEGMLVGEQKYLALAGFGKKQFEMQLDSILKSGNNYELLADIRPIDSTLADTFQTATYTFDLLDPVDVELMVLDLRDDSPIPGALVTINDSIKTTDGAGEVSFYKVSPGIMPVQIEREDYLDYLYGGFIVRNDTSITIRMTPVSHSLTLYISNRYSGIPLADVTVGIDGNEVLSDQNGKVGHLIYSGNYPTLFSHERYADLSISLDISKDTVVYVEMDQILANAKFVVKLKDASLPGASVNIGDETETTSAIGMATFLNLETDTAYPYSIWYLSEIYKEDTVVFRTDSTLRFNFKVGVNTDLDIENQVRLFPNPADNHIRVSGIEPNSVYEIRDLKGRILLSGNLNNGDMIDVSELKTGIYFLKSGDYPSMKFNICR